jgi:haloacetate dehalogenase
MRRQDRREFLKISSAGALSVGTIATTAGISAPIFAQTQSPQPPAASLFPGFQPAVLQTSATTINLVHGGKGRPVLLLHGWPQTHVIWHKIAPRLAQDFHVVVADLRGYGDSGKPSEGKNHEGYSKRAMAQDQVEIMQQLGFETFAVVGHDRGGRVGHRMALDHPARVTKLAVLDIVPTHKLYNTVSREFATAYWHWFFLIQPAPLPETFLSTNADFFINRAFGRSAPGVFRKEAVDAYLRAFRDPATIHAGCEDYRAAATIDLSHDDADIGRKISCPVLALWAAKGPMNRLYKVLETWQERAANVTGKSLPSGHFLPEEAPDETYAELQAFLST